MKIIKLFTLFLLIPISLYAGGSVYTRYGLGDLHHSFSSRRFAMGELGIALGDQDYLNYLNPAGLSRLGLTRFEVGNLYNGIKLQNSSGSVFHSNTYFNGFMIGFPISHNYGISISAGVVPYSSVNYEIMQTQKDLLVDDHNISYKGEGGISKLFFSGSYRLPFDVSLGISFDYYNGKIANSTSVIFDAQSQFNSAVFNKEFYHHGFGFTTGLISNNFADYFGIKEIKDFRIGITYSPSLTLNSDSTNLSTNSAGTFETSTGTVKSNIPYKIGAGAAFNLDNNYIFIIDYLFQPLSQLKIGNIKTPNIQDFYKMSFGFEYRPTVTSYSFWELVMWRGGLSYEQSPYKFMDNSIKQLSLYTGFSIPIGFESAVDFGFMYGKRGTTDNNLLLENIYKFSVTLSIGEFWFIQTER